MKLEKCPHCESKDLSWYWVRNRMLQYFCHECNDYIGEPTEPEMIEHPEITVYYLGHGSNCEIFDKYGHCASSFNGTIEELQKEVKRCNDNKHVGFPFKGVFWPDHVEVIGTIVK